MNVSILDLVPIVAGSTPAQALRNSLDLAQLAERLGYKRYWVAEHHNMIGIASAATSVVIGYLAAGTKTIRVGAGGVMLPNHAPLVIAEQFGTLEALYPGRIELGLGRAPGTDRRTVLALRRDPNSSDAFPQDVQEIQALFAAPRPGQIVQAIPGSGLNVPLWILGSSTFGAQLAAKLGLPYAFASHFAPDSLMEALHLYRTNFEPSEQLAQPYAMAGINVVAADTDAEARRLFTTVQQQFANLARGKPGLFQPPVENIEEHWSYAEKAQASSMLRYAVVGSRETVRAGLQRFKNMTQADEFMVVSAIYDHSARRHSYEILAEVVRDLHEPALTK